MKKGCIMRQCLAVRHQVFILFTLALFILEMVYR